MKPQVKAKLKLLLTNKALSLALALALSLSLSLSRARALSLSRRAGDTLESLATRFGTSSTNLLEANPDIAVCSKIRK
jgi:hypothetical protein